MRRSLVGAAASNAAACLSAWPKLCSKLLKSLTNRNVDDNDDLDGDDDDDATTDVERLLRLRDVAAPSVRSKALSSERTIELMNQRMRLLFFLLWAFVNFTVQSINYLIICMIPFDNAN